MLHLEQDEFMKRCADFISFLLVDFLHPKKAVLDWRKVESYKRELHIFMPFKKKYINEIYSYISCDDDFM